jgi:hypothetical protein
MERINYSEIIQKILTNHSVNDLANGTEIQLIFDTVRHHYQVLHLGWKQNRRVYGVVIHVDIIDDKIWIQRDGTEIGIANELTELGIPKQDIVLGFKSPLKRHFTDFATG